MSSAWFFAASLGCIAAIRLFVISRVGLFNDEAYYWEWSRRLGISYFDHPPVVAYLIAASNRILGHSSFAVHFPATVLSVLTSIVLYQLTLKLFPGRRPLALTVALVFNCIPLLSLGAIFTTPDAPCVFFWVLSVYLFRLALERSAFWYLAGASLGLGLLSKYNFALLPAALFLYLLISPHRRWLRRKEPYLAAAIMAVFFLPVIVWNLQNQGASFLFHLVDRHRRPFTPILNIGRFFAAQMSLSPLVVVACVGGWIRSFNLGRKGNDAHLYLVCVSSLILFFFAALAIVVLVNPNWFAVGYVTLLISGIDWLAQIRSRFLWLVTVGLAILMSALFYVQALFLALPLPPRLDFATDLHGWREIGQILRDLRQSMPYPERVFVFSRRFQFSALADFYGGDTLQVTRLGGRKDEYDYWRSGEKLRGKDAIFFCDDQYFYNPPGEYPFEHCERATEWPQMHHGRTLRTFYFWRCYGYSGE